MFRQTSMTEFGQNYTIEKNLHPEDGLMILQKWTDYELRPNLNNISKVCVFMT